LRRRLRAELLQPIIESGWSISAGSGKGSNGRRDGQEKGACGHDMETAEDVGVAKHESSLFG
jgi:hypothetical protein